MVAVVSDCNRIFINQFPCKLRQTAVKKKKKKKKKKIFLKVHSVHSNVTKSRSKTVKLKAGQRNINNLIFVAGLRRKNCQSTGPTLVSFLVFHFLKLLSNYQLLHFIPCAMIICLAYSSSLRLSCF